MRYNNLYTITLIVFILSIFIFYKVSLQKSTIYTPVDKHSNKQLNYLQFRKRTRILKANVDKIASLKTKADDFDTKSVIPLRESETVVYNRIDKAGSTTLISK